MLVAVPPAHINILLATATQCCSFRRTAALLQHLQRRLQHKGGTAHRLQAQACLSTGPLLTIVFLTVLVQGGGCFSRVIACMCSPTLIPRTEAYFHKLRVQMCLASLVACASALRQGGPLGSRIFFCEGPPLRSIPRDHQPPTKPPPITNYQPPTAANHHQPPPTASRQPPTANRHQPTTANRHQRMSYTRCFCKTAIQEFFPLLRTPLR